MRYALIDEQGRLHAINELDENSEWQYPSGFSLVLAEGFHPDPMRDYADYVYDGSGFVLDPRADLPPTLDELVAQKVAEALAGQSTT